MRNCKWMKQKTAYFLICLGTNMTDSPWIYTVCFFWDFSQYRLNPLQCILGGKGYPEKAKPEKNNVIKSGHWIPFRENFCIASLHHPSGPEVWQLLQKENLSHASMVLVDSILALSKNLTLSHGNFSCVLFNFTVRLTLICMRTMVSLWENVNLFLNRCHHVFLKEQTFPGTT